MRSDMAAGDPDAVVRLLGLTLPPLTRGVGCAAALFHTCDDRLAAAPLTVTYDLRPDLARTEVMVSTCVGPGGRVSELTRTQLTAARMRVQAGEVLQRSVAALAPELPRGLARIGLRCDAVLVMTAHGRPVARLVLLRPVAQRPMTAVQVVLASSARTQVEHALRCALATRAAPPLRLDMLTPRQRDVAQAALAGASNAEIAADLSVTEATVKTHMTHIFRKLGIRSRAQLLSRVHGELEPPAVRPSDDIAA